MTAIASPTLDMGTIKASQQAAWSAGDFAEIGIRLTLVGELLCEAVDLRGGQRVLDVATGNGCTALAAARRSCEVIGIDFARPQLERGRAQAEVERLPVDFREGDAERLPFPDAEFDVVLSSFGVMFAPDHHLAAREMLRVCRPGGKIGLANWMPLSFPGRMFRTVARYRPPSGLPSPVLWGTEPHLRELFGDGISHLSIAPRAYVMRFRSTRHWIDVFRNCFGPLKVTMDALDEGSQAALTEDLEDLLEEFNESGDSTLVVPCDYLEVVATRSG